MYKDKNTRDKISELLKNLAGETSPFHGKGYADQIERLVSKLAIYESVGKLDHYAALDFLQSAEKSFEALARDLAATREKLDADDSRREVLLFLTMRMESLVGEMKNAYSFINRF